MKRIAVLLIVSAALLSACTSIEWVRSTVDKQYKYIVTLEQQQKKGNTVQKKYEHPNEIGLASLEKLMAGLMYIEKVGLMGAKKQSPVFQAVEIDRLAPVLVEALVKANANQRVRFISFNQGSAFVFSVSRKTEGVVFVESDGRLNIAFNFINSKRQPNESTSFKTNFSKVDPLKIKTSDTPIATNVSYVELHKFETGKQAPMWVVADLEKQMVSISTTTVPIVKVTEEAPPPKIKIMELPVEKTTQGQVPEDMLEEVIKNKLKFLKELLAEGLISKEDYNTKKMELLNNIH